MRYIRLSELHSWESNPKDHDIPYLKGLIRAYGFNQPPAFREGILYVGNGRVHALFEMKRDGESAPQGITLDTDGEWFVPVMDLDHLTEAQAKAYAVQDNQANQPGKINRKMVRKLIEQGEIKPGATGLSEQSLRRLLKKEVVEAHGNQSTAKIVPAALLPREALYDIPLLDLAWQADFVDAPFIKWGTLRRADKHEGTIHFYTDDYKFSALLKNPYKVVDTLCTTAVEPNFSTYGQMPLYEVLYYVGQKRYMARLWQENHIRILVDLNVMPDFAAVNLLGVPEGWGSYCIRGLAGQTEYLESNYRIAKHHAGQTPHLFVVYGGGNGIQKYCQDHHWLWLPEHQDQHTMEVAHGQ